MSMQDPLADFFTRIRNAQMARHPSIVARSSKVKVAVCEFLQREGFIESYETQNAGAGKDNIHLKLKYFSGQPVIQQINRVSRPGLRVYRTVKELPTVRNGYGLAIVSTSLGILSDKEARKQNVGGEILATVF